MTRIAELKKKYPDIHKGIIVKWGNYSGTSARQYAQTSLSGACVEAAGTCSDFVVGSFGGRR